MDIWSMTPNAPFTIAEIAAEVRGTREPECLDLQMPPIKIQPRCFRLSAAVRNVVCPRWAQISRLANWQPRSSGSRGGPDRGSARKSSLYVSPAGSTITVSQGVGATTALAVG